MNSLSAELPGKPKPGIKSCLLQWKCRVSTSGPPGKSLNINLLQNMYVANIISQFVACHFTFNEKSLTFKMRSSRSIFYLWFIPLESCLRNIFLPKATKILLCFVLKVFKFCFCAFISFNWLPTLLERDFPDSSVGKESACNAGDSCSIPGLGRSAREGIGYPLQYSWASLVAQLIKNPPAMREVWVWSLGKEDPLEEGTATPSSILAWRIPWTV